MVDSVSVQLLCHHVCPLPNEDITLEVALDAGKQKKVCIRTTFSIVVTEHPHLLSNAPRLSLQILWSRLQSGAAGG